MPQFHDLKTWPQFYQPVVDQIKNFEGRKDDRNYQIGDYLVLREFHPDMRAYTGRKIVRRVTYVLHAKDAHGLKDGYVVLGMELCGFERSRIALEAVEAAQTRDSGANAKD